MGGINYWEKNKFADTRSFYLFSQLEITHINYENGLVTVCFKYILSLCYTSEKNWTGLKRHRSPLSTFFCYSNNVTNRWYHKDFFVKQKPKSDNEKQYISLIVLTHCTLLKLLLLTQCNIQHITFQEKIEHLKPFYTTTVFVPMHRDKLYQTVQMLITVMGLVAIGHKKRLHN